VQNMMTFNKCSINGRSYGDAYDEVGNPIDVTDVRAIAVFSLKLSLLLAR